MSALKLDYTSTDDAFGKPFIDVDEWRDRPRRHRYVHGGFEGTQTLFSFYFPEQSDYRGRFIQWLEGGAGGSETTMVNTASAQSAPVETVANFLDWFYDLGFDDLGAYLIESNQGHYRFQGGLGMEDDIKLWRASAESARFSKYIAQQIYGQAPHHGYVGGASGGGIRSISCIENAPDIYDGGVPTVCTFNPSTAWTAQARAMLMLEDVVEQITDATEPGGSGDPFVGLSALQRDALVDLYRVGWPRQSDTQLTKMPNWAFQFASMEASDPEYFNDFWKQKGYVGADTPELLAPYRVTGTAKVTRVLTLEEVLPPEMRGFYQLPLDTPMGLMLDVDDPERLFMANITLTSGAATGRDLLITKIHEGGLTPFGERTPEGVRGIKVGDEVKIDNRKYLAFAHYYRYAAHSLPEYQLNGGPNYVQTGKPFTVDGAAIFPQRTPTSLVGRDLSLEKRGHKGAFETKMILVGATKDAFVLPPQVVDYVDLVRARYGKNLAEQFRFYWVENASHIQPAVVGALLTHEDPRVWQTRLVDYLGTATRQSFRYVVDWVEQGKPPPADTAYSFSAVNALEMPLAAAERRGIQPVVSATANGGKRADVKVGDSVTFEGRVDVPPGAGTLVVAEWDFLGIGAWPVRHEIGGPSAQQSFATRYTFDKPGTYFVAFRAGSHPDGGEGQGQPVHNLDRVRVVVSA